MLNAFTSIIFNFTVDEKNDTSLKKISGYLFVDNTQTYFKDHSTITEGRFEKYIVKLKQIAYFHLNRFT
jgi:hypothetical protein